MISTHALDYRMMPIDEIHPHPDNARKGNVKLIAESLQINGQYSPVIVNRGTMTGRENEIVAGHHVVLAARSLGWTHVECRIIDVDSEAATRILLVDNRLSDLAVYDERMLAELIGTLPSLDGTGFDEQALADLLHSVQVSEPDFDPDSADDVRLDKKGVVDCPNCGHTFEPKKYTTTVGDDD